MLLKYFIISLFICLGSFGQSRSNMLLLDGDETSVFALDLNGSEYMLRTIMSDFNLSGSERLRSSNGILASISDSVKGHWVLDTTYANDNAIDSVTQDLTTNAINLTTFGTRTFTGTNPVYNGNAMYFDGSTYLHSSSTILNFTNTSFSIEVWAQTTSTQDQYILGKHTGTNNYFIRMNASGIATAKIAGTGGSVQIYSQIKINDGRPHLLTFTVTIGSTCSLYVDGILQAASTHTVTNINTAGYEFTIGNIEPDFDYPAFVGWISEVRILRRVLAADEVKGDYARYMEKGFDDEWTNAGNHTIDSTTTSPQAGTYAGKIISTGAGSSSTNYVSLPIAEPLLSGSKYLVQYYVKTIYASGDSITSILGSTSTKMPVTTSWVKKAFHIAPTSTISSIKFFLNQQDTMYIDGLTIQKKYDALFLAWIKTSVGNVTQYLYANGGGTVPGFVLYTSTSDKTFVILRDQLGIDYQIAKTVAGGYSDGNFHLVAFSVDNTGNLSSYFDNQSASVLGITTASNYNYTSNNYVATNGSGFRWNGQIGGIQFYKFDTLPTLDITSIYNSGRLPSSINGTPPVTYWDWAGTNLLKDKVGTNNMTGTNVDITDQVKVGTKYK